MTVREMRNVIRRLELWILKTPTGELRNLLTDCRTIIERAIEVAMKNNGDL